MLSVGLFFRVCVSLWNGFWGPSIGAEADATSFHQAASNLFNYPGTINELSEIASQSQNNLSHHPDYAHGFHLLKHFYAQLLARVYFLTTDSLFIGGLFSALVWFASSIVLIKIMNLLETNKSDQFKAMAIYSLLPSSILFTGVTLREPFQLLLVNLAMYSALKVYLEKFFRFIIVLPLLIVIMKKIHLSLFLLGIFIAFSLFLLLILRKGSAFFIKGTLIAFAIALATYSVLGAHRLLSFLPPIHLIEKGLPAAIERYLSVGASFGARTQFVHNIELKDFTDLILFAPKHFLQYLFEPMPWRVSTILDLNVLLENLVRFVLIWKGLAVFFHTQGGKRLVFLFSFLAYLFFEALWSVGTVNWGTAIRHHVPTMGLLIASAFAYSRYRPEKSSVQADPNITPHYKSPGFSK